MCARRRRLLQRSHRSCPMGYLGTLRSVPLFLTRVFLAQSGDWNCVATGYAYGLDVGGQVVDKSWTRGLVIHPIATAAIFVAWLLSFSTHLTVTLIASLVSFLGATLTLIVFAIDIALYARVKARMNNIGGKTNAGPAFWMTLVVLVLATVSGCVVCFGRRRAISKNESYEVKTKKPFWHRFRRGH
ncbi:hypothetical protein FRC16_001857 [Serendipita sp. 398]|nr:hypothetical protein FRC16_001857 [Serendipita sp. 398]